MSKNISIQEGGIGKQMTVSKIKVNNVGGGTSLWVPEDSTTLVTKNISRNGTYKATSDNAYGYSQVTANIAGGDGSATSSGIPTTSNGVDPGGIGSSVVGKDTSGVISGTPGGDGNEYAIGIDSNGNIVATKVPSAIEIGKEPDKTSYSDGETIDYSGIIVILKGGDSAIFSNADYPNGRVPIQELIFPVTTASLEEAGESGMDVDFDISPFIKPIPYGSEAIIWFENNSYRRFTAGDSVKVTAYRNARDSGYLVAVSGSAGKTVTWSLPGSTSTISLSNTFTYDSKTIYYYTSYNAIYSSKGVEGGYGNTIYPVGITENKAKMMMWGLIYGTQSGGKQEIPVQWKSRYDGRTFEDSFEITVTPSGGGFSDDSGGSESGGGGNF